MYLLRGYIEDICFVGGEGGDEWVGIKTYSAFGHSCVNVPLSEVVDSCGSSTCILIGSLFALSNFSALRTICDPPQEFDAKGESTRTTRLACRRSRICAY